MTKLDINVGHFKSLPWVPAYVQHETWPVNLVACESSGVRHLAEAGLLDITPMAAADWFELEHQWPRLRNFGISIRERAESVVLFSQKPLAELDEADIAICGETQNSVRVLQALLQNKHGLRIGRWSRDVDDSDDETPRLLIQNQAVAERQRGRFKHLIDIGQEWHNWMGLPLVSAVWVRRSDADPAAIEVVENLLASSLQRYRADPAAAVDAHKRENGWSASVETVRQLHRNFDYELGGPAELALERMRLVLPREVEGFANAAAARATALAA
jgi:chorismate dehydratase